MTAATIGPHSGANCVPGLSGGLGQDGDCTAEIGAFSDGEVFASPDDLLAQYCDYAPLRWACTTDGKAVAYVAPRPQGAITRVNGSTIGVGGTIPTGSGPIPFWPLSTVSRTADCGERAYLDVTMYAQGINAAEGPNAQLNVEYSVNGGPFLLLGGCYPMKRHTTNTSAWEGRTGFGRPDFAIPAGTNLTIVLRVRRDNWTVASPMLGWALTPNLEVFTDAA